MKVIYNCYRTNKHVRNIDLIEIRLKQLQSITPFAISNFCCLVIELKKELTDFSLHYSSVWIPVGWSYADAIWTICI